MGIETSSSDNYYLYGNLGITVVDYFNAETGVATIPIGQEIFSYVSIAPVPESETVAVLYKCVPLLQIGSIYSNTQIYQGIPNTYQIGSYNYSFNGFFYERNYVNYKMQALKECSACYPVSGGFPDEIQQDDFIGVIFPSTQTCVDTLSLYLPNAEIDTVLLILQFSVQQLQTDKGEGSFVWNSLSAFYE